MKSQKRCLDVHEFNGNFQGKSAFFRMTSVIGHVLSIDFPPQFQSWEKTDPAALFGAPTVKNEANPKVGLPESLRTGAESNNSFPNIIPLGAS